MDTARTDAAEVDLDALLAEFLADADEQLIQMEEALLFLESHPMDPAAVDVWLASQPVLDKKTILTGAGVVLTSVGVRDSVTKIIEQIRKPH